MNHDHLQPDCGARNPKKRLSALDYDFAPGAGARFVQVLGAGLADHGQPPAAAGRSGAGGRGGGRRRRRRGAHPPRPGRHHHGPDRQDRDGPGRPRGTDPGRRRGIARAGRQIQMVMGDTSLVPDDGTDRRQPHHAVDRARRCARAPPPRGNCWSQLAAKRWSVEPDAVRSPRRQDHARRQPAHAHLCRPGPERGGRRRRSNKPCPPTSAVTPVKEWKVLGTSVPRPNRRDLVTGAHQLSLGPRPARDALRQGAAPAVLRRQAGVGRPRARPRR